MIVEGVDKTYNRDTWLRFIEKTIKESLSIFISLSHIFLAFFIASIAEDDWLALFNTIYLGITI